ncbi:pentapeptide repeat-containing protein [Actinomadura fulvescens]
MQEVVFTGDLLERLLAAITPLSQQPELGTADFSGATFTDNANFEGATFTKDTSFSGATFTKNADFHGATFTDNANFEGATFTKDTSFSGATFTRHAIFHGATFTQDADFGGVTSTGEVYFGDGTVEGRLLLRTCAVQGLVWAGARISGELVVEAAVARVDLSGVRASGRVGLRLRGARVDLSGAVFTGPVTVHGLQTAIGGVDEITIRWDGAEPGGTTPRVKVVSLHDADAERLVLTDVDLSECRFAGMQQLEKITLDGRCRFAANPRGTRQMLAEEHHWRAHKPRWRVGRAARWTAAPDGVGVVDPARLEVLYRQLRKALEDSKNEPGAADFYYGEMQMRRHSGRGGRGLAERTLVWLYWLVSGYGLRAWRAITTLLVVVAVIAVGVKYAGFPGKPVPYIDALLYSVRSAFLINVKTTNVPETVTRWGEVFRIILRIAMPLLLGLAALAIRNRVKR